MNAALVALGVMILFPVVLRSAFYTVVFALIWLIVSILERMP